jgi:hypothetical protein
MKLTWKILLASVIALSANAQTYWLLVSSNAPFTDYSALVGNTYPETRTLDVSDWKHQWVQDFVSKNPDFNPTVYPCVYSTETKTSVQVVNQDVNAAISNLVAAKQAMNEQPLVLERPLEISSGLILLPSSPAATNGFAIAVDESGAIMSTHWYGSPTDSVQTIKSSFIAANTNARALRGDLRTVHTNTIQNIADVQAVSSLTNGFNSAEARQTINALRAELIDAERELRNLSVIVRRMMKDQTP